MLADFFAGLPNEGEAINAPAARQLMKSKPLVFMNISSCFDSVVSDVPLFRGCPVSRMRREYQLLLVNRPPSEVSS